MLYIIKNMKIILLVLICVLISFILLNTKKNIYSYTLLAVIGMICLADMYQFKSTIVEKYSESVFIDQNFKDMVINDSKLNDNLALYFSCFDPTYINLQDNTVQNQTSSQKVGAIFTKINKINDNNNYSQLNGFLVSSEILLPSPDTIINVREFSIFFYMKINFNKVLINSQSSRTYKLISFDHHNVINSGYEFMNIELRFEHNSLNPSIYINMLGNSNEQLTYKYTKEDYYNNKIFFDDEYHVFCFTKKLNRIEFYVDNQPLIQCIDDNCFDENRIRTVNDGEIKLRFDTHTIINKGTTNMNFYLCSFGIYSKYLDKDDVQMLVQRLTDMRFNLSPRILEKNNRITNLNEQLHKYEKNCPFTDESVCTNRECYDVENWRNMNNIIKNPNCFRKVNKYCNDLTNYENNEMCTFMNDDNVFKMASSIDSNLFHYNPDNGVGNVTQEQMIQQLKKLGLRDIYLDKSFDSKNNGEINRLINQLLETQQTVNVDKIDALYDLKGTDRVYVDTEANIDISSNDTLSKLYADRLAEKEETHSNIKIENVDEIAKDLITLDYDEIQKPNVYDNVMKNYKLDKMEDETNSIWNFWNVFSFL